MNNDQKILKLKEQIAEKKKNIGREKRFTPLTNCSIEMYGIRKNINVLGEDELIGLIILLNAMRLSAKDLGITKDIIISGYNVNDWIVDINSRLASIEYKSEIDKLKIMEAKLDNLLSNEKKVELEIDEIENMIKE